MNIYSNKPSFSPSSILVNKCNDSWNNINGRYAKLWVLDIVKDVNIEVLNLMSRPDWKTN